MLGCDPFSGAPVERSLTELLDGTPDQIVGGRKGAFGTLWLPDCTPTNLTGNGSCFLSETEHSFTATMSAEAADWLAPGLGLSFDATWVAIRQRRNDGTSDFLVMFQVKPKISASWNKEKQNSIEAAYSRMWYSMYRALDDPPPGSGVLYDADTVWKNLVGTGKFLVTGPMDGDTRVPDVPPPFLWGSFDLGSLSGSSRGIGGGLTTGKGPWIVDTTRADPANPALIADPVGAPGAPLDRDRYIGGDVIKVQPALLTGQSTTLLTPLLRKAIPAPYDQWLEGKLGSGVTVQALDMSSVGANGNVWTSSIELVFSVPITAQMLGTAPEEIKTTLTNAWRKTQVKGQGYLRFRYTNKVDLTDRTPGGRNNRRLWASIEQSNGLLAIRDIVELYSNQGAPAIQMYAGGGGEAGLGGGSRQWGNDRNWSVNGYAGEHELVKAWQGTPGNPQKLMPWTKCTDSRFPYPDAARYGDTFRTFAPTPSGFGSPVAAADAGLAARVVLVAHAVPAAPPGDRAAVPAPDADPGAGRTGTGAAPTDIPLLDAIRECKRRQPRPARPAPERPEEPGERPAEPPGSGGGGGGGLVPVPPIAPPPPGGAPPGPDGGPLPPPLPPGDDDDDDPTPPAPPIEPTPPAPPVEPTPPAPPVDPAPPAPPVDPAPPRDPGPTTTEEANAVLVNATRQLQQVAFAPDGILVTGWGGSQTELLTALGNAAYAAYLERYPGGCADFVPTFVRMGGNSGQPLLPSAEALARGVAAAIGACASSGAAPENVSDTSWGQWLLPALVMPEGQDEVTGLLKTSLTAQLATTCAIECDDAAAASAVARALDVAALLKGDLTATCTAARAGAGQALTTALEESRPEAPDGVFAWDPGFRFRLAKAAAVVGRSLMSSCGVTNPPDETALARQISSAFGGPLGGAPIVARPLS